ncbi:LacI family DNA-binding transcriptional regulator [Microbacterium invictum]|uniref:LacI family DNA-binding transcriptional regulator n=1 Tax=Microbacterium invictum TaxID=515415 RepID=A0ABZ0VAN6_9MICO|nr:LacI family DNA-binding transcriptional regulator [Microbacterium invictum]WQB70691.1 LacI family DNA-binding transcriptional regulator [Microbacterium invictum]
MAVDNDLPEVVPTIYDVALLAGVSHMTVSRVINGAGHVRERTRNNVIDAMRTLNYVPNAAAQELARRQSKKV